MSNPNKVDRRRGDSDEDLDEIEFQQKIQNDYTKNLVKYAALMKENALNTESFLENDKHKLEKMGDSVDANYNLSSSVNKEVKGLLDMTSSSIWTDLLMIGIVLIGFVGIYFFMKIVGKPQ